MKGSWALPYRKTSLTGGSHTNNTNYLTSLTGGSHTNNCESQFLVFKDTLLQRVKKYNTNSLFDKFTELMEHYQNKLLPVASGSFDRHYSRRFKGKSKNKDEYIAFKLSDMSH